jgi:hypothetical protein
VIGKFGFEQRAAGGRYAPDADRLRAVLVRVDVA